MKQSKETMLSLIKLAVESIEENIDNIEEPYEDLEDAMYMLNKLARQLER